MRRLILLVLLPLVAWPQASAADLRITNTLAFTRTDGSAVPFAQDLHVWCGRWDREVPRRTLHIRTGAPAGPFWRLRAVVADLRRRPVVRLPNLYVWNKPGGARLFVLDGDNELSWGVEKASGRISFGGVRCGRRLAVRFRVRAELGSEFFGGEPLTVRGSFRAST